MEETRWDLISCAAIYNTVPTLRFLKDIFKRKAFGRLISTAAKKIKLVIISQGAIPNKGDHIKASL